MKFFVRKTYYILAALPLFAAMTGCESTNDGDKQCGDTQVLVNGECVDSNSLELPCDGDDDKCKPGYFCGTENKCEPRVPCTDHSNCGGGTCTDGACVNPLRCVSSTQCIPGYLCDPKDETCHLSPCKDGCTRGVCSLKEKRCVDSSVCTLENEQTQCLEGSKCIAGACLTGAKYCESDPCQGHGVCNQTKFKCENASDCQGNSALCLRGFFCDGNTCEENECVRRGERCSGGGICRESDGRCVNSSECSQQTDCLPNYKCVKDNEQAEKGSCREENTLCDASRCSGNQICQYDDEKFLEVCSENTSCNTGLDCLGARACRSHECVDIAACTDDRLAGNHSETDAVAINSPGINYGALNELILCSSTGTIEDYYTFSTDTNITDTFYIDLTLNQEDLGNGDVELIVKSAAGKVSIKSDEASGYPQRLHFDVKTNSLDVSGGVKIIVKGTNLKKAGIRYNLEANYANPLMLQACVGAKPLPLNTEVRSDLSLSRDAEVIVQSCGDHSGTHKKDLWKFELKEASTVSIGVTGQAGSIIDPVLSVKSNCLGIDTEVKGSCKNETGKEAFERFEGRLEAGVYTVVVASYQGRSDDAYFLKVDATPLVCYPGARRCSLDGQSLETCNSQGDAWDSSTCSDACDANLKSCRSSAGDTCQYAIPITIASKFDQVFDFNTKNGTFTAPASSMSCGGVTPTATQGKDIVFEVTIPVAEGVRAKVERLSSATGNGIDPAIYVVETCQENPSDCLQGMNGGGPGVSETLNYINNTKTPQVRYFVVDSASSNSSDDHQVRVTFEYFHPVCKPGETKCSATDPKKVLICKSDLSGFEDSKTCLYACSQSTNNCEIPGDSCQLPIVLEHGDNKTVSFDGKTDAVPRCPEARNKALHSVDMVFSIDLKKGDKAKVTAQSRNGKDIVIWLTEGCYASSCLVRKNRNYNASAETFEYRATEDGTYYLVIEGSNDSDYFGDVNVKLDVDKAQCDPLTYVSQCSADKSSLDYCTNEYKRATKSCACKTVNDVSLCESSTSSPDAGSRCETPLLVNDGTTKTGTLTLSTGSSESTFSVAGAPNTGACFLPELNGSDKVYAFSLAANELLTVTPKSDSDVYLYLFEKCGLFSTCHDGYAKGKKTIEYATITQAKTVFLVIDQASKSNKSVEIDWSITSSSMACTPYARTCNGGTVTVCKRDGSGTVSYQCPRGYSCLNGACRAPETTASTAGNATCAAATEIQFTGSNPKGAFLLVDMNKAGTGISGEPCGKQGKSLYYSLTLNEGDTLRVEGLSQSRKELNVALVESCLDVKNSCQIHQVTKKTTANRNEEVFAYRIPKTGTYYLIFSSISSFSNDGYFSANIWVEDAQCDPHASVTSCDGEKVRYCTEGGTYDTFSCKTGSCDAATGRCQTTDGDTCLDAIEIARDSSKESESGTISGNLQGKSSDPIFEYPHSDTDKPAIIDQCMFPRQPWDRADAWYRISLKEGDVFSVSLETSKTGSDGDYGSVMLVDSCYGATCLATTLYTKEPDVPKLDVRKTSYVATKDMTLFVVVQAKYFYRSSLAYTLKWKVEKPATGKCVPGTVWCESVTEVVYCDENGTPRKGTCPFQCKNGICGMTQEVATNANSCDTAYEVNQTMTLIMDDKHFTNTRSHAENLCLAGLSTVVSRGNLPAHDYFFKVNLQPKQTVRIHDMFAYHNREAIFSVANSCSSLNHQQCTAGVMTSGQSKFGDYVLYEKTAGDNAESFVVAFDGKDYLGGLPLRRIVFEYLDPECNPATFKALCDGTDKLKYCNRFGQYQSHKCSSNTCKDGYCSSGDGSVCLEAEYIDFGGVTEKTIRGSFAMASNHVSLSKTNTCTGDVTEGPERVYAVKLTSGQTLNAELKSLHFTYEDVILYVSKTCGEIEKSCLKGADASKSAVEKLTYQATEDGVYYIFVDSFYNNTLGNYELKLRLQ